MKKVVVATLLAVASTASMSHYGVAQTQVNLGSAQGGITLPPAEYNDYNNAVTQTTDQGKATAMEAYLTKYPNSQVKADVLQQLMGAYANFDPTKALSAADRLLQVDPNNLQALTIEVYFRKASADQLTDPTQKQAAMDAAAGYAQKGLTAAKPNGMNDADWSKMKGGATPVFYSAIGAAALNKKDTATAINAYKKELVTVPVDQTKVPGQILTDTYLLGTAYLQSTPQDLVNCAFYVTRASVFAPEPYKSQMLPTAQYCYKKYHGDLTGYDAVTAAATANLNPPAGFSIVPAPKPSDLAHQAVVNTPDLATLALSDKEFILTNGSKEDADKVFDTIKGKSVEIPDAVVIAATSTQLQVAVSDDAVQTKAADFTFNFTDALKTVPNVGDKVTLVGTYASYTQNPTMIVMSDASIPVKKKAPVHHTTHH